MRSKRILWNSGLFLLLLLISLNCGGGEKTRPPLTFQPSATISGTVYEESGNGNYSPINNALIYNSSGNLMAISSSDGTFSCSAPVESNKKIYVDAVGFTKGSTIIDASTNKEVNFYLQKLDDNLASLAAAGSPSPSIKRTRNLHNRIINKAPAAVTIESSDKKLSITISNWNLTRDIQLVLTAHNTPNLVPMLDSLKQLYNGLVVASADITILTNGSSTKISSDSAGFAGQMVPKLKYVFCPLDNWEQLRGLISQGLALKLCYFYNDEWHIAGDGVIKIEDGGYLFTAKSGVTIPKLATIAFVIQKPEVGVTIQGTVTNLNTGNPLGDVEVRVSQSSEKTITSSNGNYSLNITLPFNSSSVTLLCSKLKYYLKTEVVKFNSALSQTTIICDFQLVSIDTAMIKGIVSNSNNQPVSNAEVTLLNTSVFTEVKADPMLKTISVASIDDATFQWYYQKIGMSNIIPITAANSNTISETDISSQLKNDGIYGGAFILTLKVTHSNPSFVEQEEVAAFDMNLRYISSDSVIMYSPVAIYGGAKRGYYYGTVPYGAQITSQIWKVRVDWYDSVNDSLVKLIPAKSVAATKLKLYEIYDWINQNADTLTKTIPGRYPLTYLNDTVTVKIRFEIVYANDEDYDTCAEVALNITSVGVPLEMTNIKILPTKMSIFKWRTLTDSNGFYIFPGVQPIFTNKLGVFAEKTGFMRSNLISVGSISEADIITENLQLNNLGTPPAPPEKISAILIGQSIVVKWTASQTAASYKIFFDNDAPGVTYANYQTSIDTIQKSFTLNGLAAGKWYIAVRAVNQYGESNYSTEVSVYLPPANIGAITGTITYNGTRGSVNSEHQIFVYLYSNDNRNLEEGYIASLLSSSNNYNYAFSDIPIGDYTLFACFNADAVQENSLFSSNMSYSIYNDKSFADARAGNATKITVSAGLTQTKNITFGDKYILDKTPPAVSSISPIDSVANVSIMPTLVITFSEPMDINSFVHTGADRWLRGNVAAANAPDIINWSNNNTVLTYNWNNPPFTYSTVYNGWSRTDAYAVKDIAGNILTAFSFSFTTISTDSSGNVNTEIFWEISTDNFSPPAAKYETIDYVNYTLKWEAVAGATVYEIIEADNPNFNNYSLFLTSNSYYNFNNRTAGIYYFRIRAVNGNYKSRWGDVITMTVPQTGSVQISW